MERTGVCEKSDKVVQYYLGSCGNPNGRWEVKSDFLRGERPGLKENKSDLNTDKLLHSRSKFYQQLNKLHTAMN